jgi:hypothetical protein
MIKVKAGDLHDQLKENLQKHRADYTSAMSGYWDEYKSRLEKAVQEVKKMKDDLEKGPSENPLQGLVKPRSYENDYLVAISMMERIPEDTDIELDTEQYKQLWLDDWGWKQQFVTTNASYSGR